MASVFRALLTLLIGFTTTSAIAQDEADLAKQLANPLASLISLPFQFNHDYSTGQDEEGRGYLNIQPVIPFSLSDDWNLISRTIIPIDTREPFIPSENSTSGLGDIVQSLFFSPSVPTANGVTWGVGPVFLFPTATKSELGSEKWGIGPTGVVLRQNGPWTYGGLANHIWSFAGDEDRSDISSSFVQPFLNYTFPSATTLFLNSESTYNWKTNQWAAPVNFGVNQMVALGKQRVQLGLGGRYWADAPDNGPEGWGVRVNVVFLFPK